MPLTELELLSEPEALPLVLAVPALLLAGVVLLPKPVLSDELALALGEETED